ncbi:RNA polymerase sigma factor [Erwinia psidii]
MDDLVRGTNDKLHKFISRRVYNRSDAEDLVQMTYLEAFRNQHKFAGESSKETWLFGIASNLIRNYFKTLFNKPEMVDLDEIMFLATEESSNPDHVSEYKIKFCRMLGVVDSLPVKMQDVIYFIMDTDSNYHDVARQLGIPVGTVRSRLSRARGILKSQC